MFEFTDLQSYSLSKADDVLKTRQWFRALQFYALSLGHWRRRRTALANIMINGTRKE